MEKIWMREFSHTSATESESGWKLKGNHSSSIQNGSNSGNTKGGLLFFWCEGTAEPQQHHRKRHLTTENYPKLQCEQEKGWKVGDPIDKLTAAGKEPSWSTVRARYWKNQAYYNAGEYSEQNLIRMRQGLAPKNLITGESMELHHIHGRNIPNPHAENNLMRLWPSEHAQIDPHTFYTGPIPEVK